MAEKKIEDKYLQINYHAVAKTINYIHGTKYAGRQIKMIHKGTHARTEFTFKKEIESIVDKFERFYTPEGKLKYGNNENK